MIRHRLFGVALVAALLVSLPGASLAQEEGQPGPEGVEWALISVVDETTGEPVGVPWEVQPTLLLEDGLASGFGGCNRFSGSYVLDGSALRISEQLSVTLALCEGPAQLLEDGYLAALGRVDGWAIDDVTLRLYDGLGDEILAFEVPSILWTPSQLASLVATLEATQVALADLETDIDRLRRDTDALNVPRLRERIRALEAENERVQRRLDALESAPTVDPTPRPPTTSPFSAAERVLLRGIPTRIASRCSPLRSGLPKGTRAAVTCRPNTNVVATADYFLLEGERAASQFGATMETYNVPDATAEDQTCEQGVKSQRFWIGGGWQAEGCFRENKRAQLRFVDNATECKRLRVGGKTLRSPAFYIALQATDNDVARLHDWATRAVSADSAQLTAITQPIPSDLGISPSCPT